MSRPRALGQLAALFAVLAVVLFVLAGLNRTATQGAGLVLGNVGWFGFWISLLGLVVVGGLPSWLAPAADCPLRPAPPPPRGAGRPAAVATDERGRPARGIRHTRGVTAWRRLGTALLVLLGLFLLARAVVEVVTVHPSRPETYRDDWAGPRYLGVVLVHAGPGLLVLGIVVLLMLSTPVAVVSRPGRARALPRPRPAAGRR